MVSHKHFQFLSACMSKHFFTVVFLQELYSEVEPAYAETGAVSLNVSHSYAVLTSDQSTQQRGTMHSTCAAAMVSKDRLADRNQD